MSVVCIELKFEFSAGLFDHEQRCMQASNKESQGSKMDDHCVMGSVMGLLDGLMMG